MGASESTPTTNGTNQEEERKQESGGAMGTLMKAAVASIAVVGVAAVAISKMLEENEKHAMKMKSSCSANSSTNTQSGFMSQGPYKMNTDGSCRPYQSPSGYIRNTPDDGVEKGPSGFGGILRDERGRWVQGFIGFIDISDCTTIEIHGIYNGLILLDKLGLKESILESDCEAATSWIAVVRERKQVFNNLKSKVISDCWDIITECGRLADKNIITIRYCSRDANKCADKLADMAVKQREPYREIVNVPPEIKELVDHESSNMW